jgi:hypothetical protein
MELYRSYDLSFASWLRSLFCPFFSFQFNHLILVLLGIRLYFFIFIFHKIIMILWLGLLISLFESSFFILSLVEFSILSFSYWVDWKLGFINCFAVCVLWGYPDLMTIVLKRGSTGQPGAGTGLESKIRVTWLNRSKT